MFTAIAGSAITYGLTPEKRRGGLGNLSISPDITETQGLFVELILTMVLVFTVLASTSSDHNRKDFGYANGLAIGISITVAHLVGVSCEKTTLKLLVSPRGRAGY